MKTKLDKQLLEAMSKDLANWRGFIYYNRKDPRIMVPKRYPSMGWTFNFASPYAYITLGLILIIAITYKLITKCL